MSFGNEWTVYGGMVGQSFRIVDEGADEYTIYEEGLISRGDRIATATKGFLGGFVITTSNGYRYETYGSSITGDDIVNALCRSQIEKPSRRKRNNTLSRVGNHPSQDNDWDYGSTDTTTESAYDSDSISLPRLPPILGVNCDIIHGVLHHRRRDGSKGGAPVVQGRYTFFASIFDGAKNTVITICKWVIIFHLVVFGLANYGASAYRPGSRAGDFIIMIAFWALATVIAYTWAIEHWRKSRLRMKSFKIENLKAIEKAWEESSGRGYSLRR